MPIRRLTRPPSPYRLRDTLIAETAGAPAGAADTFNRANSASGLGTSSSGHTWLNSDTWAIASNRAVQPNSAWTVAVIDVGLANVTIQATLYPLVVGGADFGLGARWVDDNNYIFMDISLDGDHYVTRTFQRVGGTFSAITSGFDPVPGVADTADPLTLKLTVNGSAGESFINGASMGTWSSVDATLVTPTKHGLSSGNNGAAQVFDNLTIVAA